MVDQFKMSPKDNYQPGWLSQKEGNYLRHHAQNTDIPHLLEIGSFFGRSASYIIEGLKACFHDKCQYKLWCIDPWIIWGPRIEEKYGVPPVEFWKYMVEQGYDKNIHFLKCSSEEASSVIAQRQYGFAFIDGAHWAPMVMHDILLCSRVTRRMLLHDYCDDDRFDVKECVYWWVDHTDWEIVEVSGRIVKIEGPLFTELKKPQNKHPNAKK
jgi:hypothetical protein